MLRDAFFVARKDVAHMFRAPEIWFWAFLLPILFSYFFGTVTSGFGGSTDAKESLAVSVPADAGFLADHLLRRLEERNYRVVRAGSQEQLASYRRRLVVPAGFTASVLAGKPVKVTLTRAGDGLDANYDQVRVGRAVYSVLADLMVVAKDQEAPGVGDLARLAAQPRLLTLEVQSAGQRQRIPTGYEHSVPGTLVMMVLLVLVSTGAVMLVIERRQGILRRLASAPMSRGAVVLGKWGARMTLGVIQIGFMVLLGAVVYRVHWGPSLPVLGLVLLAYAGLCAALGMALAGLARTEGQVIGFGVIATNVLAAIGGCWWPIEITPLWLQKLALTVPTGWAMDALHKLVSFGASPASVIPHLIGMTAAALAAGWVATRVFRFQ
jgi:ABC-type Na+ efflux pump permease subunit